MNFYRTSINSVIAGILSTVVAIIFAYAGYGFWAIVLRRVAMTFFIAVGGWLLCPWIPSLPRKTKEFYSVIKFVFNTYGNFTLSYVSRNLDNILIGKFYGEGALGFYDRAYHLAMLLPNQLSGPLSNVAITTLSKLKTDTIRFRRNFEKILSIITFVTIPLSVALSMTGKDIVLILLGAQWGLAGEIFQNFAPTIGLLVIHTTPGWVHLSLGRADRWFKWGVVRVFCASISIIIGLAWGPKGVAAAYSIYMALTLFPAILYAAKPIGVNFKSLLILFWRYITAGSLTVGIVQVLLLKNPTFGNLLYGHGTIIRISLVALCVGVCYSTAIIILFRGIRPFTLVLELFYEFFKRPKK